MTRLPYPLVPGFNPDPSVVLVDGTYYLVTSSFEYLPGLALYASSDFETWRHIGNVATDDEQTRLARVPTGLGVWAPTIRHHDGRFHVIVSIPGSGRRCVVYSADRAEGPWTAGITIPAVGGIDPDLMWSEDGTAWVTFAGGMLDQQEYPYEETIRQVPVDLRTGTALGAVRPVWGGTGMKFPEGPHLYHRGSYWYLFIAEGGTERGHAVTVARSHSPHGPFVGSPHNPLLTHRSTNSPVQNVGHGDLVTLPDGSDAVVVLGVRPLGFTRAFSPLGRETFASRVRWVDDWPVADMIQPGSPQSLLEEFAFRDGADLTDPGWVGVRRLPAEIARVMGGELRIAGTATGMADGRPAFIGRRQRHFATSTTVIVDPASGSGGLAMRYDETSFVTVTAERDGEGVRVRGLGSLPSLRTEYVTTLNTPVVVLGLHTSVPDGAAADTVTLSAAIPGQEPVTVAEFDGRFWSAECAASFTGRVVGVYAMNGTVAFRDFRYLGTDDTSGRTFSC